MKEKTSATLIKANRSFKWTTIAEVAAKIMAPIINMVLARFIAPEIFGIVASISIIVSFAELFSEGGFSRFIVQKEFEKDDSLKKYSGTANISTIAISILIFFIILFFRNNLSKVVGASGYEYYLVLAAVQIPAFGFCSIQTAVAKRKFEFKKLSIVRILVVVLRLAVSLIFALANRPIEALVLGTVIPAVAQSLILIIMYRKDVSFRFSFTKLREMFTLSILFLGESFVSWLSTSIGTFLIVYYFDQTTNGLYKNAFSTVSGIVAIVVAIYSSIMVSLLSRTQNDRATFSKIILKYQKIISFITIPMGFGIFFYKDFLTSVFFGSGWEDAAIIVGLFGIGLSFNASLTIFIMTAFTSLGKPIWNILINAITTIGVILSFVLFAKYGFTYFMISRICVFFIVGLCSMLLMFLVLKTNPLPMLYNLFIPFALSLPMSAFAVFQQNVKSGLVFNAIGIISCIIIYFVEFYFSKPDSFKDFLKLALGREISLEN